MRSLADNYQSTPYREALTELAQKVDETGSLYEGMRESPLFPAYVREMVRLGERLGELENVCHGWPPTTSGRITSAKPYATP